MLIQRLKCPEGHEGLFDLILIGLVEPIRTETWLRCRNPGEDGYCDYRFPMPTLLQDHD